MSARAADIERTPYGLRFLAKALHAFARRRCQVIETTLDQHEVVRPCNFEV